MTIRELYEHSQNVGRWMIAIDGLANVIALDNPAIMAGVGNFHINTFDVDVEDGKPVIDMVVATKIVTD